MSGHIVDNPGHPLGCQRRIDSSAECTCGFGLGTDLGRTSRADVISPTLAKLVARACGDAPRDGDKNPNSSPK